jgi:hypothetical protein
MKNIIDPFTKGVNPFDELDEFYRTRKLTTVDDTASEEARERINLRCLTWLKNNALLAKYIEHVKGNRSMNTLPEHALGERLYAMLTCVLAAHGTIEIEKTPFIRPPPGVPETMALDYFKRSATGIAVMLLKAQVYLWSDKMEKLADASPLPPHTVSREVLPMPIMFWSRETRYNFPDLAGRKASNNWMAFIHETNHMLIVADMSYHDTETTKLLVDSVVYNRVWPDEYHSDDNVGRILKRCAFLASPFVVTDRRRMTHATRRQLERDYGMTREETNEPEANVVVLRRLKFRAPQKPTGDHPGVEWKHHWWVGKHYRAQWYPSLQAHKVIWIAAHIKGDLTKPLLEKVYAVRR